MTTKLKILVFFLVVIVIAAIGIWVLGIHSGTYNVDALKLK